MSRARVAVGLVAVVAAGALLVSGGSEADPRTPQGLPGMPPPFLGTAVVGSGGLTVAIDAYGDVVDLRAPGPAGRALIDNPAARQTAGAVPAAAGIVPWVRSGGGRAPPPWVADSVAQRHWRRAYVGVPTAPFWGTRPWVRSGGGRARPLWLADSVAQRYWRGTNVVVTTAHFGAARVRIVYAAGDSLLACLTEADEGARVELRSRADRRLRCDDATARR